jgi:hypothetical protein
MNTGPNLAKPIYISENSAVHEPALTPFRQWRTPSGINPYDPWLVALLSGLFVSREGVRANK